MEQAEETENSEGAAVEKAAEPVKNSKARWYIVHAYSGFEKKIAKAIQEDAAQQGLSHMFEEVTVPAEDVLEMRRGKKVSMEKKFFPGYVLVKMEMNDASWHLVKSIPKVTGFLGGGGNRPQPISQKEAERIFSQLQEGMEKPKDRVIFEVGEQIKVIDGPFESFVGVIEEVDPEKERIKVSVSIFGRPTPVDLQFSQVEKVV